MGWRQPYTGTTHECVDAHAALDEIGVPPGSLAARAMAAVALIVAYTCDRSIHCNAAKHAPGCRQLQKVDP